MGRRSRKRAAGAAPTRAERDAARRERPRERRSTDERPPAPWGRFPLVELLVLVGIGVMIWGVASWNEEGNRRFAAGLLLAALGGLELSVREHFAGYRSHTTLLAGVAAFAVVSVLVLASGPYEYWILLLVAVAVFGSCFYALRRVFQQRSGGLSFR
jgi:hypothetical protein